jgi:hypothetical protein
MAGIGEEPLRVRLAIRQSNGPEARFDPDKPT